MVGARATARFTAAAACSPADAGAASPARTHSAILISVGSLHGRPEDLQAGRQRCRGQSPSGTVRAGKPVCGEMRVLLLPCGVLRSPISRGGLFQVGYTSASSRASSIVLSTPSAEAAPVLVAPRGISDSDRAVAEPAQSSMVFSNRGMEFLRGDDVVEALHRRLRSEMHQVRVDVVLEAVAAELDGGSGSCRGC